MTKSKQWRSYLAGHLFLLGAAACGGEAADDARPQTRAQTAGSSDIDAGTLEPFSFFLTSLRAMQELSGSAQGFGGDLRFGETGEGAGLRGADKICTAIAEESMPGSGKKVWRAFLSTVKGGPDGSPVHAIDRIGEGPWYDRVGRLVALKKADLLSTRPTSADPQIKNDLPNEDGVPNHNPDGTGEVDNHDVLTGTGANGKVYKLDPRVTCNDWTKSEPDPADAPRVGHSWPRSFPRPQPLADGGMSNPFADIAGLFGDGGFPAFPPGFNPFGGDGGFPGFPPGFNPFGGGGFPGFPPGFNPFGGDGGLPPFPAGFNPFGSADGGIAFPGGFNPFGGRGRDGGMGGNPFGGGGNPFGAAGAIDMENWISSLDEAGCGAGVSIIEMGPPWESNPTVGSGGGYGGIYCFALTP